MNSPLVSLVLPCYQNGRTLARTVHSIQAQTVRDWELIAVDDGSADDTLAVLQRLAQHEPRMRVLHQENGGVSAARNAGLDAAEGTWISFVDSDDEVLPDIYETLSAQAGDEDAVYFSAEELIMDGDRLTPVHSSYFDVTSSGVSIVNDDEISRFSMVVWDKLFRREKIESIHLRFPEGLYFEDNVFIINFFSLHHKVRFLQKKLYRYFRRSDSITGIAHAKKNGMAFNYIHILDAIHSFWRTWHLLPEKQALFERFCIFYFRAAIKICQDWERPGLVYELARSLHSWQLEPENDLLRNIKQGILSIRAGRFPGKDITMLKTLKGFEKILYIGNFNDNRIVYLFSMKIASWRRPKRI